MSSGIPMRALDALIEEARAHAKGAKAGRHFLIAIGLNPDEQGEAESVEAMPPDPMADEMHHDEPDEDDLAARPEDDLVDPFEPDDGEPDGDEEDDDEALRRALEQLMRG